MEEEEGKKKLIRVVFFPILGVGHLISNVEMAKQLLLHHPFSITILTMQPLTPSPQISSYIDSVTSSSDPNSIRFQELPPLDPPQSLEEGQKIENILSLLIDRHKPLVRDAIAELLPVAGFFMDFFANAMIDVADDLGIPSYLYFSSSASALGLFFYIPTLHVEVPSEFEDVKGDVVLPGLPQPVPPLSMPTPMMDKKDQAYTMLIQLSRRFGDASGGIVANTFAELEPYAIRGLEEGLFLPDRRTPPVYPVGPLLKLETTKAGLEHECIRWLDSQPPGSVVFLCFGSMGSFMPAQVLEMAVGLERSGHRFLWSLRNHAPSGDEPADGLELEQLVLPEGFLERTKERGMVWPRWAPQVEILSHPATGGFVTHCGWNSCLESLWFGVPMVAWPLYAEQHFNAFDMVRNLGVAVELKLDRKRGNFVEAEELEKGVRCLMEGNNEQGNKVRENAMEMKEASRKALVNGGSSFDSFEKLTKKLTIE